MKRIACMLFASLIACGPDVFVTIPKEAPDASDGSIADVAPDASDSGAIEDVREAGDAATPDAKPDAPPPVCDPGDVTYAGKCFYLDGSGGACSSNYAVSSDAALGAVLAANPNAFQGKNYRSNVSANCCVFTTDNPRNFGMVSHCNLSGPFGAGEPKYAGNSCVNISASVKPDQLTLCERSL